MMTKIAQWQRLRVAQTLWNQNDESVGFSWFHEQGLPTPFVLDEVKVLLSMELTGDILKLRLKAAQADGRLLLVQNEETLRDVFDRDALHVKLILRNQLVACGRVVFLKGQRSRSEINESLIPLPDSLLTAEGMVEISRVCTHPDFRRGHLLTLLLGECAFHAFQRGGKYLLGYCVSSLVPVYLRFAGEKLPYSGKHPLYEGKESFLVRIDLEKVMRGEQVPFLAWARFIAPHLREMGQKLGLVPSWTLWAKSQGALLLRPCLNEALKLTSLRRP